MALNKQESTSLKRINEYYPPYVEMDISELLIIQRKLLASKHVMKKVPSENSWVKDNTEVLSEIQIELDRRNDNQ
jgi:hypothetical protein